MKNILKSFKSIVIALIYVVTSTSCNKEQEEKCDCGMITGQYHNPGGPNTQPYSIFTIKNNCTKEVETVIFDYLPGVYQDFEEICDY